MKRIFQKNIFTLITAFAVCLFVVAGFVHAQDFIEPSDQAPKNNVLDFMSQSGDAQARFGKLRIGSDVIPNDPSDPVVDVVGSAYLQGNANFDRQTNSGLVISISQTPRNVKAGTNSANGKFTVQNVLGPAVYATSLSRDAVVAKVDSDMARAVFGQTSQVSSGSESSGVIGVATDPNGAGIFAQHQACPGGDISVCGTAAQFVGNVVVTGVIRGDGRGIVRTWTMNDATGGNAAKGISVQTFDVTDADFTVGIPRTWSETGGTGIFSSKADFIAMSVLVGGSPYDPAFGRLPETDANYLAISFSVTDPHTLEIKKGSAQTDDIVVLTYYHQQLDAEILDENGNSIAVENAMIGSNTQHKFTASIGGGAFNGGEFLWSLHTDANATSPECQNNDLSAPGSCGSIDTLGTSTVYIPPTNLPSTNTIYLKAVWAADPSIFDIQQIDLYQISITQQPGTSGYVLIGQDTFDFNATSSCPGSCPALEWSLQTSHGAQPAPNDDQVETINSVTGLYTSPLQVVSNNVWVSVVRVGFQGMSDLYKETYFNLYPKIEFNAYLPGDNDSNQGPWTDAELPSVAVSQTLMLRATAVGIPGGYQSNFNWAKTGVPAYSAELLTSTGAPTGQTNAAYPEITYTSPQGTTTSPPYRTVSATWRKADGTLSPVSKTLRIYVGRGPVPETPFTQEDGTTGSEFFTIYGFGEERKLYSFCSYLGCTDEQVIDWSTVSPATPLTVNPVLTAGCGTLQLTGYTQNACNPDTQLCTANMNFSFSATGTGLCRLYGRLAGDSRSQVLITLDPTSGSTGCLCKSCSLTPECCIGCTGGGGVIIGGR